MARNKYKTAQRSIWYVLRTLIVVAGVVALCFGIFVEGMQLSNLYILATEGLEARADTIINADDPSELTVYFTDEFVKYDGALYRKAYEGYTVSSYDYRLSIKGFFVLPWSVRATMTVDESLAAINAAADNADEEATPELPKWEGGRYQVSFTKIGSRWYISALTLVDANPVTPPKATPDMSLMPEATPDE